jgi:hypothetical protein
MGLGHYSGSLPGNSGSARRHGVGTLPRYQVAMVRSFLAFALLGIASVAAQEPSKAERPSADAQLNEFARTNPDCISFTDLCQTCVRTADRNIECSTPGIACIRQPWTCTLQRQTKEQ